MKKLKLLSFFMLMFFAGLIPVSAISWKVGLTSLTVTIDENDLESVDVYLSTDNQNYDKIATLTSDNPSIEVTLEDCKTYYLKVYDEVNSFKSTCSDPEDPVEPGPEDPVDPDPEDPVEPDPEDPVEPDPEDPVDPDPEEPQPEDPVTPEPEEPVDPDPEQPTPPSNSTTNNTTQEPQKQNPETGSFIPLISIATLAALGIAVVKFKKSKIRG